MSSRCALRITEQGEAGPPAFTAFLGLSRAAAGLGEHHFARSRAFAWCVRRCARSRAWGACGAPLRPHFGLICLEPKSMHPPCCVKRVHERHESPFFGQILTLVYTFWVPLGHLRTAARPMCAHPWRAPCDPCAPQRAPCDRTRLESLLHRARAPCAPKEWLARAHHIDDVLTTLPLALHCLRNAHAFRSRALRWHNALSPYCDDVPAARGSRRGDIGGGLEAAPFRLAQCGG